MPRPGLREARRREQAVDDPPQGRVGGIGDEGLDLHGRGRQAAQIKREPADQGAGIGGGRGLEAAAFEGREQETVQRLFRPGRVPDGGDRRGEQGLPGPMLGAALLEVELDLGGRGSGSAALGPRRPALHPLGEVGDLLHRKLSLGGHLELDILIADGLDERTLVGPAGNERGAGVSALEGGFEAVEPQSAFQLRGAGAVAGVAAVDEDGADFFLEELGAGGIVLGRSGSGLQGDESGQEEQREGPHCEWSSD